jgi:hypothetical protein
MMLFTFPQSSSQDGNYIRKDGSYSRLAAYEEIAPARVNEKNGLKWSSGWSLRVPRLKEERYTIVPLAGGNINLAYFEELCVIKNQEGKHVGYCFAELLPGVRNEKVGGKLSGLLSDVEY